MVGETTPQLIRDTQPDFGHGYTNCRLRTRIKAWPESHQSTDRSGSELVFCLEVHIFMCVGLTNVSSFELLLPPTRFVFGVARSRIRLISLAMPSVQGSPEFKICNILHNNQ
jgi:hypothetical protein